MGEPSHSHNDVWKAILLDMVRMQVLCDTVSPSVANAVRGHADLLDTGNNALSSGNSTVVCCPLLGNNNLMSKVSSTTNLQSSTLTF